MTDLCLVPNIVIPLKFKVLDFDRYKGTTYPKNHLNMYCQKMGAYSRDEKFLMQFFQDSLARVANTWYTSLEPSQIHSWKDLMVAFVRQYQYNADMAPVECSSRTCAKRSTNLSKSTPRDGGIWRLR